MKILCRAKAPGGCCFSAVTKGPFLSIVLLLKYLKATGLGGGKECVCFGWALLTHALLTYNGLKPILNKEPHFQALEFSQLQNKTFT